MIQSRYTEQFNHVPPSTAELLLNSSHGTRGPEGQAGAFPPETEQNILTLCLPPVLQPCSPS